MKKPVAQLYKIYFKLDNRSFQYFLNTKLNWWRKYFDDIGVRLVEK